MTAAPRPSWVVSSDWQRAAGPPPTAHARQRRYLLGQRRVGVDLSNEAAAVGDRDLLADAWSTVVNSEVELVLLDPEFVITTLLPLWEQADRPRPQA